MNGIYYNILINAFSEKHNSQVFNSISNILFMNLFLLIFFIMKMSKVLTCTAIIQWSSVPVFFNIEIISVVEDIVIKMISLQFQNMDRANRQVQVRIIQ